ncbi:NAD-binding protein [uncultured Dialister sp.]|uniref:NAD-binding protein n=1 Tax=uncultured Dialister sp. TaxID=278064 RepID=UPI00267325AF|nr:NAD-binding protein [uncultured Dialister sp.]
MRSRDASKSDLLVAVTAMDEVNIIACMLAKKNGIPHTIARIRDPKFLSEPVDYIKENFDIDLVLSPELITAREISRLVMTPSAINVEDFAKGRVRLLEMKLSPRSPFAHKELKDITLPPSVLIALILRDHHMIIPTAVTGCCRWTTCISLEIRNPLQKFHPTAMPSTSAERRRPSSSAPAARGRPWLPCWRSRGFQ